MIQKKSYLSGVVLSAMIASAAYLINDLLPIDFLGATLLSLLLGMLLNPIIANYESFEPGISWSGKKILRYGIILAESRLVSPK